MNLAASPQNSNSLAPDSLSPGSLIPHSLAAQESLTPESVALESVAPDSLAPGSVASQSHPSDISSLSAASSATGVRWGERIGKMWTWIQEGVDHFAHSVAPSSTLSLCTAPSSTLSIAAAKSAVSSGPLRSPTPPLSSTPVPSLAQFHSKTQALQDTRVTDDPLDKIMGQMGIVFDHLPFAFAYWDKKYRLKKCNPRFASFFNLDLGWLTSGPTVRDVFEALRSNRMLPEVVDFSHYTKKFEHFFRGSSSLFEEILHLPDERTLRFVMVRLTETEWVWIFVDLTDFLELERLRHGLFSLSECVAEKSSEGVLVCSLDHRIIFMNTVCATWWKVPPETYHGKSLAQMLRLYPPPVRHRHVFEEYLKRLARHISKRQGCQEVFYREDGQIIQFNYVPLPKGENLFKFTEITETVRSQECLRESKLLLAIEQYLFSHSVMYFSRSCPVNPPEISASHTAGQIFSSQGFLFECSPIYAAPPPFLFKGSASESSVRASGPSTRTPPHPYPVQSPPNDPLRSESRDATPPLPVVHGVLSLHRLLGEVHPIFLSLLKERQLTLGFQVDEVITFLSNEAFFVHFLARLLGMCCLEAHEGSTILISASEKDAHVCLEFFVKNVHKPDTSWHHPWDLGFRVLKDMALRAGCVLRAVTTHPQHLRLQCFLPTPPVAPPLGGQREGMPVGRGPSEQPGLSGASGKAQDTTCG